MNWSAERLSLQWHREYYSTLVVGRTGVRDERLMSAFASIPRERFLGPGPWKVFTGVQYVSTVVADPRLIYQDVVVALKPALGINNGQPSLYAQCFAACKPSPGNSVLHIGCGTGYYTAILAELVTHTGSVIGYEIDSDLASDARANLDDVPHAHVIEGSGAQCMLPEADLIMVSAGTTGPADIWLDALKPGGRLVLPLTPSSGAGCMLMITRSADGTYVAASLSSAFFIPCTGARNPELAARLSDAFRTSSPQSIRQLLREPREGQNVWFSADKWSLMK